MMQPVRHTQQHSVKDRSHAVLNVCAYLRLNSDDVFPLELTDLFLHWCFKMSLQSHGCTDGNTYWYIYEGIFTTNIWPCLKSFFCFFCFFLFSPSASFSTQQQSREWSSHPCKGVSAWLCVCVCDCVRDESSTHVPTPAKDVGSSQTPVGDGTSCPSPKEQT